MLVEIKSPYGQEPKTTHKAMLHGFAGIEHCVVAVCQPLDGAYLFEVPIYRLIMPDSQGDE
jgi:hypothetical protein